MGFRKVECPGSLVSRGEQRVLGEVDIRFCTVDKQWITADKWCRRVERRVYRFCSLEEGGGSGGRSMMTENGVAITVRDGCDSGAVVGKDRRSPTRYLCISVGRAWVPVRAQRQSTMGQEVHGPETISEISPGQLRPPEPGTIRIIRQWARRETQRAGIVLRSPWFEDEKAHKLRAPHDQDHDLALVRRVHVRNCLGGSLELEKTYPGRFKGSDAGWNTVVDERPCGIATACLDSHGVCGGSAAGALAYTIS